MICSDRLRLFVFECLLVVLKVWLMPFVYDVSKSCFGTVNISSKFASEFFSKVKMFRPRVPQGMPTSVHGGPPQRFRTTGRKKHSSPLKYLIGGSEMETQIWKCVVCWVRCVNVVAHRFGIDFEIVSTKVNILFMIYLIAYAVDIHLPLTFMN